MPNWRKVSSSGFGGGGAGEWGGGGGREKIEENAIYRGSEIRGKQEETCRMHMSKAPKPIKTPASTCSHLFLGIA